VSDPGFQFSIWAQRFPALMNPLPPVTTPTEAFLQVLYSEALLLPEASRITNDPTLSGGQVTAMMNLMVAHLVAINNRDASIVGRISQGTQGSVAVATDYPVKGTTEAWWGQTQYGAELWRMMAPYRTMQYAVGPGAFNNPNCGPFGTYIGPQSPFGFGFGGWGWPR
jgi:hypothetical protein